MRFLLFLLLLCGTTSFCCAQAQPLSSDWQQTVDTIIELVKHDRVTKLAKQITYPLKRRNPVPDIDNAKEFVLSYPMLFDEAFKRLLITTRFTTENTIERYDLLGLGAGALWLDSNGKIIAINNVSKQEAELADALDTEAKSSVHSSIAAWKRNIYLCQTDKFILRVDLMPDYTLRYASWSKPKTMQDKPDLVLTNGTEEFQGSMGGVTYSFSNEDWEYQLDQVNMAERGDQIGLFFRLFRNGVEKASSKTSPLTPDP